MLGGIGKGLRRGVATGMIPPMSKKKAAKKGGKATKATKKKARPKTGADREAEAFDRELEALFERTPPHGGGEPTPQWKKWAKKGSPMEVYMRHMWAHPPRCAAGRVEKAPAEAAEMVRGIFGPLTTVFEVPIPEGAAGHRVWARPFPKADAWSRLSPFLLGSDDPKKALFVFDERKDGYDGEFGHLDKGKAAKAAEYRCSFCKKGREFGALVGFQYNGNNEELDDPKLIERRQDFFSWFVLATACAACGEIAITGDVECA